jgi:MOSC domain-containing protein
VSPRVAWISHCPVKGLAVRQLDHCELTEAGVVGDREFFLVDENDRLVNAKGLGVLQQIVPRFDRDAGVLTLAFPDGTTLSRPISFNGSVGARFWKNTVDVRIVDGPWSEALSDYAGRDLRLVRASAPAPDRLRSGAATLLGTGSLRALARTLGATTVDARRFRMNFGIDGLGEHTEDEWLGRRVRLGEAVVVPQGHVGRCAVTTQNPDTGVPDLDTLKALAAYRPGNDATEPLPFGVHAAVTHPGRVRVGDPVELARADSRRA